MSASETAKMIDILTQERPLSRSEATEFLDYVDKQKGDQATKQDIVNVNQRIDGVNQRIDGVNQRIDSVDKRIDSVDQNLSMLKWVIGLTVGLLASIMLGGFAWLRSDMKALERRVETQLMENNKLLIQLVKNKK